MNRPRGKLPALSTAALALAVLVVAAWLGWPHLRFWWLFESLGKNEQGYPEYRHRQTGIVMVRLPGGTFWMGAQKEDPSGPNYDPDALENEGPVHEVTLSPFLVGKCEVTQAEWQRVMGDNPSEFKAADQPVEAVTWDYCQQFCEKTGLKLPTEAQWEYACRAGSSAPCSGTGRLDDTGWYQLNSGVTTNPVGQKTPNGFGLHDLLGNVQEWCETKWPAPYEAHKGEADNDSQDSYARVVRGGSFFSMNLGLRCACRFSLLTHVPQDDTGFRIVASPFDSGQ